MISMGDVTPGAGSVGGVELAILWNVLSRH
jgi:hypothetical protein